eukprot:1255066-Pyramimonas_sp.AAC.2
MPALSREFGGSRRSVLRRPVFFLGGQWAPARALEEQLAHRSGPSFPEFGSPPNETVYHWGACADMISGEGVS